MGKNREGFVRLKAERVNTDDRIRILDKKGKVQLVKVVKKKGPSKMGGYRLLRPDTEEVMPGEIPSIHTWVNLAKMEPGGHIDEHYHEYGPGMPVFDHVYYVISGHVKVVIGDNEKTVGPGALIYAPSNVRHSMTNVGKSLARILKIAATGNGEKMGPPVFIKMPIQYKKSE